MEILVRKNLTKKSLLKKLTKKDRRDARGREEERKRRKERGEGARSAPDGVRRRGKKGGARSGRGRRRGGQNDKIKIWLSKNLTY